MTIELLVARIKGRLRAVFVCVCLCVCILVISGCSAVRPVRPVLAGIGIVDSAGDAAEVGERAKSIAFASIDIHVNGTGGLILLSAQSGALTFWQSGQRQTIVLKNGYLQSTSGLGSDLLMSRSRRSTRASDERASDEGARGDLSAGHSAEYRVTRTWRDAEASEKTLGGAAELACAPETEEVELPLVTLDLQRCRETVRWMDGSETASVFWRRPETHRIWAAEVVPWPGGPLISWQVARPWW